MAKKKPAKDPSREKYVPSRKAKAAPSEDPPAATNGATPKPMVLAKILREIPVPLDTAALQRVGRELGDQFASRTAEVARQARIKSEMKVSLTTIDARIAELATVLRTGNETKEVQVEVRADYEAGMARAIRVDTGEELEHRPLTDLERQLTLVPPVAEAAAGAMAEAGEP